MGLFLLVFGIKWAMSSATAGAFPAVRVNLDCYNTVRVALDQALHVFQTAPAELSDADQQLLWQLEQIRSKVLRAESGHPFPSSTTTPFVSRSPESTVSSMAPSADSSTEAPTPPARPVKMIRVVLADDYDSVRAILCAMLAAEGNFEVVAEAGNGQEAVDRVAEHRPDIAIMDLNMPVLDGVAATRAALKASPFTKVLVFSANRDPNTVQKARDAGASGYLFKPSTRQIIVRAVRDVCEGKTLFPERDPYFGGQR